MARGGLKIRKRYLTFSTPCMEIIFQGLNFRRDVNVNSHGYLDLVNLRPLSVSLTYHVKLEVVCII